MPLLLFHWLDVVRHDKLLVRRVRVLQRRENAIVVLVLSQNLLSTLHGVPFLVEVDAVLPQRDVKLSDYNLIIVELKVFLECIVTIFIEDLDDLANIISLYEVLLFIFDNVDEVTEALTEAHLFHLEFDLESGIVFGLDEATGDQDGSRLRKSPRTMKCIALVASRRFDLLS